MNAPAPAVRGEVIFEFRRIGHAVKVSAIHVDTDVEVSVVTPVNAGEAVMRAAALNKLAYVLARRS